MMRRAPANSLSEAWVMLQDLATRHPGATMVVLIDEVLGVAVPNITYTMKLRLLQRVIDRLSLQVDEQGTGTVAT